MKFEEDRVESAKAGLIRLASRGDTDMPAAAIVQTLLGEGAHRRDIKQARLELDIPTYAVYGEQYWRLSVLRGSGHDD